MAEAAYDLRYFETQNRPKVEVRRTPPQKLKAAEEKNAHRAQWKKTIKLLLTVLTIVALVCSVLYTQTSVSELQSQIDSNKSDLVEAEAYYAYLNFELESMTNIRNVEQRAAELGLVKASNNQITYVKVDDSAEIEVQESPLAALIEQARTGLMDAADYLAPE